MNERDKMKAIEKLYKGVAKKKQEATYVYVCCILFIFLYIEYV